MNKSFLECVAADLINKHGTDFSRMAVVFPNKRAALFLNDYLARAAGKPIWSPTYITISDLFRRHCSLKAGDPIKLVAELHKVFTAVTGKTETIDQFYGWGQVLLSDFDDIDKNMADAAKVLANIADLHELDDLSYLTEEQKTILSQFLGSFSPAQDSILRQRFIAIWNNLHNIYKAYNQRLEKQGLAYEGALYRRVAEADDTAFSYDKYIFVGFNMLQKVEQTLFTRLRRQGRAHFYWDFDHYFMAADNESGHFIRQYLEDFPNELPADDDTIYRNFEQPKDITYVAAKTETAQARYVAGWLREAGKNRIADGRSTAVVLCDENLLQAVIRSLPEEVSKVNITTGYPLAQTPFASLVNLLISMQTDGYSSTGKYYRLRQVLKVLRHPYAAYITESSQELISRLTAGSIFRPERDTLATDEDTRLLFADITAEAGKQGQTQAMAEWVASLLQHIGVRARDVKSPLFQESLFRTYTLVNRLHSLMADGSLEIDITTFRRLLRQLFQQASIPFHGEPAEGLQVMGVLETRNLDFDHILLLSCNEGNMPKGISDTSFIPYSIRKAYELTTVDHKTAIYSYYFHSLLQRASDITITYNNATEDGNRGEMSRFMLQLLAEGTNRHINQKTLAQQPTTRTKHPTPIEKADSIRQALEAISSISPTDLSQYLRCQLLFYYHKIARLKEPEPTLESSTDNRAFGNIFHHAAQLIYEEMPRSIRQQDIDYILKNPHKVEEAVDKAFGEELFPGKTRPDGGWETMADGLWIIKRQVINRYLRRLLEIDKSLTPFTILGLEKEIIAPLPAQKRKDGSPLVLHGIIDRLDYVTDSDGKRRIRVVDYKTGSRTHKNISTIDDIFNPALITRSHTDYYLQTMLYAAAVARDAELNPQHEAVSPALLFIQHAGQDDYDPTLSAGSGKILNIETLQPDFNNLLQKLLEEIFNPATPFLPTDDHARCTTCPYAKLCYA